VIKNKIIYVGDSFCAEHRKFPGHVNEVKKYFPECAVTVCAAGSASWFYSRNKFLNETKDILLNDRNSIKALIFFHTSDSRINNSENIVPVQNLPKDILQTCIDIKFQNWAQQQWFREIAREYSDIPTIHYNCFTTNEDVLSLLPGMVFTTPLIHISIGELTGTDTEILSYIETDKRYNHFSTENNKIFGQHVINAINNYTPGKFEIDMSKFNIINPNAFRYPNKGYGTL
jgi:hypothetical protein